MTLQETSAPTLRGREKKGHAMRGIIIGLTIVALSLVQASCAKQHKQLEEIEEVQSVSSNADFTDAILEKYQSGF